jgi:hypothetical protein
MGDLLGGRDRWHGRILAQVPVAFTVPCLLTTMKPLPHGFWSHSIEFVSGRRSVRIVGPVEMLADGEEMFEEAFSGQLLVKFPGEVAYLPIRAFIAKQLIRHDHAQGKCVTEMVFDLLAACRRDGSPTHSASVTLPTTDEVSL